MKRGFTLSEMLLVMAVAAGIAVIALPTLSSAKPNKNLLMFRKAYYRIERAIIELVNDDNLYPEPEEEVESRFLANTDEVFYRGEAYSGSTKFCGLLAAKLGAEIISCSNSNSVLARSGFTTSDGIEWIVPPTDFASPVNIRMDVNGANSPNCRYGEESNCTEPDTFQITVYYDGRVEVDGAMEKEYLLRKNTTQGAVFETMADPNN